MPELPEVRTVKTKLKPEFEKHIIKNVVFNTPKLLKDISVKEFKRAVEGKKVVKVDNRSKFLLFYLEDNNVILSHLRMTGKYRSEKIYKAQKHDHVLFELDNGYTITYKDDRAFGTFHIRNSKAMFNQKPLSNVAPVVNDISIDTLIEKLSKRRVAIKSAMLDQTLVAGLGNIYINEALWASKIDPETPSNLVPINKVKELLRCSIEIMDKATSMGGTTIYNFLSFNKTEGGYQDLLQVHSKKGSICSRDDNPIEYKKVNGRGTFWCSKCQKKY